APDGSFAGYIGTCIDITDRQRAEEELQRHRERLEELVSSRTAELERTHEALRLSERMAAMGTLVAGLGHDMGNLLLPVRARLDALQAASLDRCANEHVSGIRACIEHLQRLASGLRLFAIDPESDVHGVVHLATWCDEVQSFMRNA